MSGLDSLKTYSGLICVSSYVMVYIAQFMLRKPYFLENSSAKWMQSLLIMVGIWYEKLHFWYEKILFINCTGLFKTLWTPSTVVSNESYGSPFLHFFSILPQGEFKIPMGVPVN